MTTQLSLSLAAPEVRIDHGQLLTTSLNVAQVFGKQHKNVLDAIKRLDCSAEFARLNFKPGSYLDANKQSRPLYDLTHDGFMLVVMGFTGPEAMRRKEAYIRAFNAMAEDLRRLREGVPLAPEPATVTLSLADYAALQAEMNGLLKDKIKLLEMEKTTQPRRRPLTGEEKRQIAALSRQGFGPADIARKLGRSDAAVRSCLRGHGRPGGAA